MPVLHPTPRTWLNTKVGFGEQTGQGVPLSTIPKWLWADRLVIGKRPRFEEFQGAFGGAHLPRDSSVPVGYRAGGLLRVAATFTNLGLLIPWATQLSVGAYSLGISKYFTIANRDHPSGRDIRIADAVPLALRLESGVTTQGILVATSDFFGEDFLEAAAGAITFTETTPADKKVFRHNATTLKNLTTSEFIGVANAALILETGFFPWDHNHDFPLARKDGPLNIRGTLESMISDRTDSLRQLADTGGFAALEFKWTSTDSPAKVLTITLNDVRFDDPPDTGYENKLWLPFRTGFSNYGDPVITLA